MILCQKLFRTSIPESTLFRTSSESMGLFRTKKFALRAHFFSVNSHRFVLFTFDSETLGFTKSKLANVLKHFVYDGSSLSGKFIIWMKTFLNVFLYFSKLQKTIIGMCLL